MPATPDPLQPSRVGSGDLPAEDAKLVTLARAARARAGAVEGAAVRDDIGRTYVAVTVALPSLALSAVQAAVAAAVASGQERLDAVAVVGPAQTLRESDRAVLDDVSVQTVVLVGPDGALHADPQRGR